MTRELRLEDVNVEMEYDDSVGQLQITIEEEDITNILNVQIRKGEEPINRMFDDIQG